MSFSITGRIRRSTLLVSGVVALFVIGVFAPSVAHVIKDFWGHDTMYVGSIAGQKISHMAYHEAYQEAIHTLQHTSRVTGEKAGYHGMDARAHRNAWVEMIMRHAFLKSDNDLGLDLSTSEMEEMLLGEGLPKSVRRDRFFADEKTGAFSTEKFIRWLRSVKYERGGTARLKKFLERMERERLMEKRVFLLRGTYGVSQLEKRLDATLGERVNVRCLKIACHTVKDSEVASSVDDRDKKAYYEANKERFRRPAYRVYSYFRLSAIPNEESELATQSQMKRLRKVFGSQADVEGIRERSFKENPDLTDSQWRRIKKDALKDHEAYLMKYAYAHSEERHDILIQVAEEDLEPFMRKMVKDKKVLSPPVKQGHHYVLYRYLGPRSQNARLLSWGSNTTVHRFLKIVKRVRVTPENISSTFDEATRILKDLRGGSEFKEVARRYGLHLYKEDITLLEAQQIGRDVYRLNKEGTKIVNKVPYQAVNWVYKDAKLGHLDLIETDDEAFLVGGVTEDVSAGFRPYEEVEKEVEQILLSKRKEAVIVKRLEGLKPAGKSLNDLKNAYNKAYGHGADIVDAKGVNFHETRGFAPKEVALQAVGAAFALLEGGRTCPVAGEHSVMVIEHKGFADVTKEEEEVADHSEDWVNLVLEAMIQKGGDNVNDRRYRFYK